MSSELTGTMSSSYIHFLPFQVDGSRLFIVRSSCSFGVAERLDSWKKESGPVSPPRTSSTEFGGNPLEEKVRGLGRRFETVGAGRCVVEADCNFVSALKSIYLDLCPDDPFELDMRSDCSHRFLRTMKIDIIATAHHKTLNLINREEKLQD